MLRVDTHHPPIADDAVLAVLPMRAGSARVRDKNNRHLLGKPLFHHTANALLATDAVTHLVITSNDATTLRSARDAFPTARLITRPDNLARGHVPMNAVLLHALDALDLPRRVNPTVLQTHATNPLLTPDTIDRAVDAFRNRPNANDALFTTTRLQARVYDHHHKPVNHDPQNLLPTQDLKPLFIENSALYITTANTLRTTRSRTGTNPLLHEIPPLEATDIDTEDDWTRAEALMRFLHDDTSTGNAA